MKRRQFVRDAAASALVGGITCPAIVRAASATTLKFVPYADLALLDRDQRLRHAQPLHDGVRHAVRARCRRQRPAADAGGLHGGRRPESLEATLRDGLTFHDGTQVLARDVVASLRRWGVVDAFGQALFDATDELSAPSDRTVVSSV